VEKTKHIALGIVLTLLALLVAVSAASAAW
jgi:hypothetical protein